MKNIVKSGEEDADASFSLSRLPDEIILEILNKLIDLKTLCFCYLVSRRFSSIVLQVDAVSFTVPFLNPNISDKNTVGDVDSGAFHKKLLCVLMKPLTSFLSKFKGVKSLCIELPSSTQRTVDNSCLFKWKVKFGSRVESFIFLSPYSICDNDGFYDNGNCDEAEENELVSNMFKQNFNISFQCLRDVMVWHVMLIYIIENLPMLELVSITDSERRGRLSLSGEKLSEVKEWVHSASETVINHVEVPVIVSNCYIPILKLPVSGYVMKGIYFGVMEMKDLQGGYDGLINREDGFEDKEEAAYSEAVMEILEKHRGMMLTSVDGALQL